MKIAVAGGTGAVGRLVVEVAQSRGHATVVLARSAGLDLVVGHELATVLDGVDAVVDVTSTSTQSGKASEAFFGGVTRNLLGAERAAGVGHHLALSIVGSDRAPFGYYAGKALQEQLVSSGPVPWTILRATQFHEFAQRMFAQFTVGPLSLVPTMRSQPVAAREVAERLVALAEGAPAGRPADLAGPEVLQMADMVRAYATAVGRKPRILQLPLPGGFGKAMRDGTILAGPDADHGTQTFHEWVAEVARASA
ncbi:MAG TPA: NAD(P)H-binding protein [Plantibacter sp.]|uniref:SDR family oxidoreductase n=1 Tax=Plantibacter sp. TaxID=1871045 RepID=UPI002C060FE1|nr:NAD(P)H-binding protein [Plantibacter sp.]